MSFIQECPNCHGERIEKFKESSHWSKEENKLCEDCYKRYVDDQFEMARETEEAREYLRQQRAIQARLVP